MKSNQVQYSPQVENNWKTHPWAGVFAATLCPFHDDESIDEEGLRSYLKDVIAVDGIKGIVTNGHTGEIMSLLPEERARVTRIAAEVANGKKVISGLSAEGSLEAIEHAIAAKEAGADAILLMPPHHWLRFGRSSETAIGFMRDVAEGANINIMVHQYPAWTKAGYTLDEMKEMIKIPQVVGIKMGTREMARCRYDYEKLKEIEPDKPIITCHDEYLLATLLEAADGALVGFAGFAPELIVQLAHAALNGDLAGARKAQALVDPLARIIYSFGEPSSEAHQRMKCARWLMGKLSSPLIRRPLRPLSQAKVDTIRQELEAIGVKCLR
ncbi:dihydrodipicolinate synthase family protein [Ruficoccus amylovorans]|uniref:Dihydrodipicolinate synthase family protein n=1 Tax=Ruficoccus amylovorans TaxID=1804625 RepID=A0A842HAV2_9BACT|nr:dihydrodipicolinate synthase family protein [Ruficoccus amylovorans]MBC2593208.1 dihydrodipicolinate synthase family protein [Ruficoccus amylovorans]